MEKVTLAGKGNDGLSTPRPGLLCWAKNIGESIPSRSDDTVPVAWTELSTVLLRSHARRNPVPNAERQTLCQKMSNLVRGFLA